MKIMNNIVGKMGEDIAVKYLKKKKYKIIDINYKNKIGEIDIICEKDKYLIFIEVKFRSSLQFGEGRFAVNSYKQNKIKQVAKLYLQVNYEIEPMVRFDVIDINSNIVTHIENAF